jgi:dUTP pyrophosphatase
MEANQTTPLKFKKLNENAKLPERQNLGDAGLDLVSIESVEIPKFSSATVRTGVGVEIPDGYAGFVQPRSSLAMNYGITVLNTPGLIDSGYRGEILVILYNSGTPGPPEASSYLINPGDRIAQLVIVEVPKFEPVFVESLSESSRGTEGLGSTGV